MQLLKRQILERIGKMKNLIRWYNESKKEWGKLSDNKMWNNKVKVKVK